ncbi:hypothetical protein AB835_08725 [Candidatus Endobugula sertula]|uniref:Uncharacterized protein n=1 Tax=Candidatus Endobugula sertula TaxID=62101 RepID=A0A1D2QPB7_9GAMM|nr:hypothetical protein AB835_08725 [Candidatus Endobugula sertula]
MAGLIFFTVIGVWFFLVLAFVAWVVKKLPDKWWKVPIITVLFFVILILPIMDEVVGGIYFLQLCRKNATIIIDSEKTSGITIWYGGREQENIELSTLPIKKIKISYVEAYKKTPIYHYYRIEIGSGWLSHILGFGSPMLFSGVCQPENLEEIDSQLGTKKINRPVLN